MTTTTPTTQAGGGFPSVVGKVPALLTEYAPVQVINTSTTDTMWLASSSSVSPATGVPLQPSTALTWTTPGALYAVLDPAAPDSTATVIMTGAVDDWSPSPVAIGAAIATQLLASGVPVASRTDLLAGCIYGTLGGWTSPLLKVTSYQSLRIAAQLFGPPNDASTPPVPYTQSFFIVWQDGAGNTLAVDEIETLPVAAFGGTGLNTPVQTYLLPVKGEWVQVYWQTNGLDTSTSSFIQVYGSTRPADRARVIHALPGWNTILSGPAAGTGTKVVIPAGGDGRAFVMPVEGGVQWRISVPTPTGAVLVTTGVLGNAGAQYMPNTFAASSSVAAVYTPIIYSPLQAQYLAIHNSGTASVTVAYTATRVPV